MKRATILGLFALVVVVLASPLLTLHWLWERAPWHAERVMLVDYTVPFENGREHAGAVWLLNHEKYPPPSGEAWDLVGSHVGYDPRDREHPVRIASQDLSDVDWLYITDSYGVYEQDLAGEASQNASLDVSRLLFGGISELDARAIADFAGRGGHLFFEFNTLESPTAGRARAILEDLLGVRWTGWTGRVFENLYDTGDVPAWLPRVFRARFGTDARMPTEPTLVLVHMDGRMLVLPNADLRGAAPSIALTARGRQVLPAARNGVGYFYWFPILTADEGTELLAELVLPDDADAARQLAEARIPRRIPMLTRRIVDGSHRIYVAGDLADVAFPPTWYSFQYAADARRLSENNPNRSNPETAFWGFYAPAFRQLLREPYDGPATAPTPR